MPDHGKGLEAGFKEFYSGLDDKHKEMLCFIGYIHFLKTFVGFFPRSFLNDLSESL